MYFIDIVLDWNAHCILISFFLLINKLDFYLILMGLIYNIYSRCLNMSHSANVHRFQLNKDAWNFYLFSKNVYPFTHYPGFASSKVFQRAIRDEASLDKELPGI